MGMMERVMAVLAPAAPAVERTLSTGFEPGSIADLLSRSGLASSQSRRAPSVASALGVPAIQRAVALISSTTGMLSVQAYRDGGLMTAPPRMVVRPSPYETQGSFYGGSAADMAKYGEFVWWIASVDGDGHAQSLVRVPLRELTVTENKRNRFLPEYRWGDKVGTPYSGANPDGRFVHVKYPLGDPFDLRGYGPLQICRAATSVSVEAQEWAATFYAEGGGPATVIKKAGTLSPQLLDPTTLQPDPDGKSEADLLRDQVIGRTPNSAMVIDDTIESIDFKAPNEQGAQMLDARQHQNGDAARMFGVPGSLLEYQHSGSSLTYQNLETEFTKFVRVCLQPLYLEPIEQAMSDLITRTTAVRFNVKGFLRADVKTRFDVHQIAIDSGIYDPAYAQREEGITPGDVEYAPVPFAQPQAVPAPMVRTASMRDVRCPTCKRLVTRSDGAVEGRCSHCKLTFLDSVA